MMPGVRERETIETRMSDGTRLVADVYRPIGDGRYPVLLMRQPYGRRIASTVVLAHPAWYASRGYIVMVQDVRGRGDSQGRFRILADDVQDGAETLAAAANLTGSDGRVATYGFSYQGMTQFMGLAGALKTGGVVPSALAVVMAPWNVRDHWAFEGGAFRLEGNLWWAVQMAAENARIAGDTAAYDALRGALGRLCGGPYPAHLDVLDAHPHLTHYHEWLADDPGYWSAASPDRALSGLPLSVPSLHVGGWLDIMLDGTFAAYEAFRSGGARTELMVGPWPHIPWTRRIGALDGGASTGDGVDRAILGFFDHVLKGKPLVSPPVRLFDLGRASFVGFDAPPETRTVVLHLTSGGRAAPSVVDGALVAEVPDVGADLLVHDPWRPAPAFGLTLGTPGGYVDRSEIDGRGDVAVFTTEPLAGDLVLCGEIVATLQIESDRPSFDVSATLSVVSEDGAALAISGGYARRFTGETGPVVVNLHRTMMTVAKGKRLRLSLAAAAWPAFMVNPGTGVRPEDAALSDALVTTLVIHHGGASPSRIQLGCLL